MKQEEKEILEVYRKMSDYMVAQDIEGLKAITTDDFRLIHMTGYDQAGAEWFEQVEGGDMRYFSSKEEHYDMEVTGDSARLVGQNRVDARIYGSRHTWPLQLTFDLKKVDGKWLISHASAATY